MSLNFVILTLLLAAIVVLRAPVLNWDWIDSMVIYGLLWIAKLLFLCLIIDDSRFEWSPKKRWVFGFIIAIILFIVLILLAVGLLWQVINYFLTCFRNKKLYLN